MAIAPSPKLLDWDDLSPNPPELDWDELQASNAKGQQYAELAKQFIDEGGRDVGNQIRNVPVEDRDFFINVLSQQQQPAERGFFGKVGESFQRGTDAAIDAIQAAATEVLPNLIKMSPEAAGGEILPEYQKLAEESAFLRRARNVVTGQVDPVTSNSMMARAAYNIAGSAPDLILASAASLVPGGMFGYFAARSAPEEMDRMVEMGVPKDRAALAAAVSGAGQAFIENRLGKFLPGGVLKKATAAVPATAARKVGKELKEFGLETAEEFFQPALADTVVEVMDQIGGEEKFGWRDAILKDFANTPEAGLTVAGLMLAGHGANRLVNIREAPDDSKESFEQAGAPLDDQKDRAFVKQVADQLGEPVDAKKAFTPVEQELPPTPPEEVTPGEAQAQAETKAAPEAVLTSAEEAPGAEGGPKPPEAAGGVERFLAPGKPLESIGAASNPDFEVDDQGNIRPRMRSAADIGPAAAAEPKRSDRFKSPDNTAETAFQMGQAGLRAETFADKARNIFQKIRNATARGATPNLPPTKEFATAKEAVLDINNANSVGASFAKDLIDRTIKPLEGDAKGLFERIVVFADWADDARPKPAGLTQQQAAAEHQRLLRVAEKDYPSVLDALEYRRAAWDKVREQDIAAHAALGQDIRSFYYNDDGSLKRQNYLHHQILEYADALENVPARGKKAEQKKRGFRKERRGSSMASNTKYAQAEWAVLSQMLSDAHEMQSYAKIVNRYDRYDDKLRQAREAREAGDENADWEDFVDNKTEGIWRWRRGRQFFRAFGIPDEVAAEAIAGQMPELEPDDVRNLMAMGGEFRPQVFPKEIVQELEHIQSGPPQGQHRMMADFDRLLIQNPTRAIKWFQLGGTPRRALSYGLRQWSEFDGVAAFNPRVFLEPALWRDTAVEVAQGLAGSPNASADWLAWLRKGGRSQSFQWVDASELDKIKSIAKMFEKPPKGLARRILESPFELLKWADAKKRTALEYGELFRKFLNFKFYRRELAKGNLPNYGASRKELIDGLLADGDIDAAAYRLGTDLTGNYNDISTAGQFLARRFFPYWRFRESNWRKWINGLRNVAYNPREAGTVGQQLLGAAKGGLAYRAPLMAYLWGARAVKLGGFGALLAAINNLLFPDEERELPPDEQRQPHLVLGRDNEDNVRAFYRLGTANDFLAMLGMDALHYDIKDVYDGRRTVKQVFDDWYQGIANFWYQQIGAHQKAPFEIALGRKTFPNLFKPRRIRDKVRAAFEVVGLEKEYDAIAGLPHRKYTPATALRFYSTVEPNLTAYMTIRDKVADWKMARGDGTGESEGGRSEMLFNYKLAKRYGDRETAIAYLTDYIRHDGTFDGFQQSLRMSHPLGALALKDRQAFIATLREEEADQLRKAEAFWKKTAELMKPADFVEAMKKAASSKGAR